MQKKIAVICNYELLEDRVGGMDYFFWAFDKACKHQGLTVDWFFPNKKEHGHYGLLNIIVQEGTILEESFIKYSLDSNTVYSHIFTHFIELCTSFFYKLKKVHQAKVIAVDHNPRPLYGYPFKKIIEKKIKGLIFSRYIDVFVGVSLCGRTRRSMIKKRTAKTAIMPKLILVTTTWVVSRRTTLARF